MKKLIYLIAAVAIGGFVASCDDEAGPDDNYGDKSIRPDLTMSSFYSKSDPSQVFNLAIDPEAPTDTTYEFPDMTAAYRCYKPVTVKADLDTFILRVNSNSRWSAAASTEFRTGLSMISSSGNGDADLVFRCTKNGKTQRTRTFYVYTNDSTVMHRVMVIQEAAQ